jgi:two-component system cell cycle sensor histidine kinase/response regulator CckA
VAHDLNNILSGVLSYPDLILSEMAPDSHLRQPIETIRESGRKAAAVVDDLVTVARGSAARFEVVDVNHLVIRFLASSEVEQIRADHPEVTSRWRWARGVAPFWDRRSTCTRRC